MTHDTKRAAAEAAALTTALVIGAKAGWRFSRGPILAERFANLCYVEEAQLLLVPSTAGLPLIQRQLGPVIRETRSDALVVSRQIDGPPAFAFARWRLDDTRWFAPLALWLSEAGIAWLVPLDHDELGIQLVNRIHEVAGLPWIDVAERVAGAERAQAWMTKTAGVLP